VASKCNSSVPHVRQRVRRGSADRASKSSSTDSNGTMIDRELLFAMTDAPCQTRIRADLRKDPSPRLGRCAAERCVETVCWKHYTCGTSQCHPLNIGRLQGSSRSEGLPLGSVIPFTRFVILPTNKQLLNLHTRQAVGRNGSATRTLGRVVCRENRHLCIGALPFPLPLNIHKTNVNEKRDFDHCLLAPTVA
jgi:hypothetical protein